MKTLASLLILSMLLAVAPAQAKPRGCFTKTEETAEQVVRQGLRLREGAKLCDGDPWRVPTLRLWTAIDQQFGAQFANQTQIRKAAFQREFEKDAENHLTQWDGRIVNYFRYYPLSPEYCVSIKNILLETQKKGWGAVLLHASKSKDEVRMDYRSCDKGR